MSAAAWMASPPAVLTALAAIAATILIPEGWRRLARAAHRARRAAPAPETSAAPRAGRGQPTRLELTLEGGPVYGAEIRFQACAVLDSPEHPDADSAEVRVRKQSGALGGPQPSLSWKVVPGTEAGRFVLDGVLTFAEDAEGLRFGLWELSFEWRGVAERAVRTFAVGYVETFRAESSTLCPQGAWALTGNGELRGEGPATGEFAEVTIPQAFAECANLEVRAIVRFEGAASEQAAFEIALAERYAARLAPRSATVFALLSEGAGELTPPDPSGASFSSTAPVFFELGGGSGEARLTLRLHRDGERTQLDSFVNGFLVRSGSLREPHPGLPWTLCLRCRGLTVHVERLEVLPGIGE